MFKKIALIAALTVATGSAALAEEYLETTGNRNAPAYRTAPVEQSIPTPFRELRLEQRNYRGAEQRQYRGAEQRTPRGADVEYSRPAQEFPRVDPLIGSGG
jgi:hypothetical protein